MTTPKNSCASVTSDGVPVVIKTQELDKTRELPATGFVTEAEPEAASGDAAPREMVDGEATVPVQSSIERTLTFEMVRRQSIEADEDKEKL